MILKFSVLFWCSNFCWSVPDTVSVATLKLLTLTLSLCHTATLGPDFESVTLVNFIFDCTSVNPHENLTIGMLDLHVKVYCLTACDASGIAVPDRRWPSISSSQLDWITLQHKTKNFFWWSCLWRCSRTCFSSLRHDWIHFNILTPFTVISGYLLS